MSCRPRAKASSPSVKTAGPAFAAGVPDTTPAILSFEDLSPTEQAAASLGVQPDSVKPISWLNDAHYEQLKTTNALDPTLSRRIEAFRYVSNAEGDIPQQL